MPEGTPRVGPRTGSVLSTPNPIKLKGGVVLEDAIDLTMDGPGLTWNHRRTYSSKQSGRTAVGNRWLTSSEELFVRQIGTVVELIATASSKTVFNLVGSNYISPADSILVLVHNSGDQQFEITNQNTHALAIFHDFTVSTPLRGKLKEATSVELKKAGETGATYAYDSAGLITQIISAGAQAYVIEFAHVNGLLTSVVIKQGSTELKKVEYTYFQNVTGASSDIGRTNDLVQVKRSFRDSASGWTDRYTQYRYGPYSKLKGVLNNASVQRIMAAGNSAVDTPLEIMTKGDSYAVVTGAGVENYASKWFTFYASNESTTSVNMAWWSQTGSNLENDYAPSSACNETGFVKSERIGPGGCTSCGGSGITKYYFYLELSQGALDDNEVKYVVIEDTVDANSAGAFRVIQGLNGEGRQLRQAVIDNPYSSPKYWCTSWKLTETSVHTTTGQSRQRYRITEQRPPSAHNVTSNALLTKFLDPYDDAGSGSWTNDTDTLLANSAANAGPTDVFTYDNLGQQTDHKVKRGRDGTAYFVEAMVYGDGSTVPAHLVTTFYQYPTKTTTRSDGVPWSYSYTFWDTSTKLQMKTMTLTAPAVPKAKNGSSVASVTEYYFDRVGRLRWYEDAEGYVTYYSYSPTMGGQSYVASDVNPGSVSGDIQNGDNSGTGGADVAWLDWTVADADDNKPTRGIGSETLPTALALVSKQYYDLTGRPTLSIGPDGDRDYVLYQDLSSGAREIRFSHLDSSGLPQLPTLVTVKNEAGQVTEAYAVHANYTAVSTANNLPTGFSTPPGQADYVAWTRRHYATTDGSLTMVDRFHWIKDTGTITGDNDVSTYFYRTVLKYDELGRVKYTIAQVSGAPGSGGDGVEQVDRRIYDRLGRVVERQRGVSLAGHSMGDDYSAFPTLAAVSTATYDGGAEGDGRVTSSRTYHTASVYTDTNLHYTFRGFLRGVERSNTGTDVTPYHAMDVDWMGRTIDSAEYTTEPSWTTLTGGDGDAAYVSSTSTGRFGWSTTMYDPLERVYRTESRLGSGTRKIQTNNYYNRNGQLVGSGDKYGSQTELAVDAAGRTYQTRLVTDLVADDSTYGKYTSGGKFQYRAPAPHPALASMTGGDDEVVEMSLMVYDVHGAVVEHHDLEMDYDDTGANLGIDLSNNDDYVRRTVFSWYDEDTHHLVAMADYGAGASTGAGSWKYNAIFSRPSSAPTASAANVLVTAFAYDPATGRQNAVTAPGPGATPSPTTVTTRTWFDDLGRVRATAENYVDFALNDSNVVSGIGGGTNNVEDRVVEQTYNALGQVVQLTAYNGGSGSPQTTTYYYEDPVNAALVTHTVYPDSSSTPASGTDLVKQEYNRDGSLTKKTDQRGVIHEYEYNTRRQLVWDRATTIPSGVYGGASETDAVRAIERTYDSLGERTGILSYPNANGSGTVLNAISYEYDETSYATRLLSATRQHHEAVSGGAPAVGRYLDLEVDGDGVLLGGARQVGDIYPDGATAGYQRNDVGTWNGWHHDGGISDRLGRMRSITFGPAAGGGWGVAFYRYNGADRLVETDYTEPDVRQQMFSSSSAQDYDAWDRFGRTVRVQWDYYGSGVTTRDKVEYSYDYAGNRLTRNVGALANDVYDYAYAYDALQRLVNAQAGTLASGSMTGRQFEQDWTLDQLGNWSAFKERDTDTGSTWDLSQTRTHNAVNEMTSVSTSSWGSPAHDAAGNMTLVPSPLDSSQGWETKYDAWNRMSSAYNDSTGDLVHKYEYDGLGRLIVRITDATQVIRHYYYNEQWQVMEERVGSTGSAARVDSQYVWHPHYIDALAMRYWDANQNGGPDTAHYYLQDANFNVTALVKSDGAVAERYAYTPYGKPTVLNGASDVDSGVSDWDLDSDQTASDVKNVYLYTGREYDWATGLQVNRERFYSSDVGRWVTRDPVKYWGGGFNLYEYVASRPTTLLDSSGKSWASDAFCSCHNAAEAHGERGTWNLHKLPTHADKEGNNAMFHCVIACKIEKLTPGCSERWNDRENGGRPDDNMDLANNRAGQSCTKDCWSCCYEKWKNGDLTCEDGGLLFPCPPPPDSFPEELPEPDPLPMPY